MADKKLFTNAQKKELQRRIEESNRASKNLKDFLGYLAEEYGITSDEWMLMQDNSGFTTRPKLPEPQPVEPTKS